MSSKERRAERRAKKQPPKTAMDCIVVGGCAAGTLLRNIKPDATFIELSRPEYIKPLETPNQTMPDVHKEKDVYEVHPISLQNSDAQKPVIFGIAVVEGQTLTWAFSQLVIAFVEYTTAQLISEGLIKPN